MLRKILVPLDGSELADRILVQVRRLLAREDAEVLLLTVLPEPSADESERARAARLEEVSSSLEAKRRRLEESGARARYDLMTGDPASHILSFAEAWGPSLIAMSTHGRTGLERWARGSTAERVLRRSHFPLLLANPKGLEKGEGRFRRILIPLDGTDSSARILPLAEEMAIRYESEVVLLHAASSAYAYAEYPTLDVRPTAQELKEMMDPYRKRLESAHIRTTISIQYDDPAAAILHAAAADEVDLVAMTTHGRTGLTRWVFGSVAEKVLRRCPCPVLVSRARAEAKGG